ncbi:hypothetical protein SFRURICE_009901 [Spodoptera frugiperda]|nr:hypothetical protein SFRURICE_009901 [Spodoptera frugiperda]
MGELTATNLFESQTILADHKDLIHDVAYDFYGERMATCSSDQYVKVWDSDGNGGWRLTASWKAHHGSVWKVTWAHPEFGQVIATCSFDRTAAIWEEVGDTAASGSEKGLRTWLKRSNLVDSRTSVTDVKFGPKHLGLLLVTCSADGIIRIYEAPDVMNLAQWTLQHEIPTKGGAPADVGGGQYSESSRRWTRTDCLSSVQEPVNDIAFAPNLGRSFHLLPGSRIAIKDGSRTDPHQRIESAASGNNGATVRFKCEVVAAFEEHYSCVWRVCWNLTGTLLASSGDDCAVRLWKMEVRGGVQERAGPGRLAPPVPATHHLHPHGHHGQPHAHALPLTPRPTHGPK